MRLPVVIWSGQTPRHSVTSMLIFADGEVLATGSSTGQVVFWNIGNESKSLAPICVSMLGTHAVTTMAECSLDPERSFAKQFVGSSSALLCATEDGSIFKLDTKDGRSVLAARALLPGHVTSMLPLKVSGSVIVCGHFDSIFTVNIYNLSIVSKVCARACRTDLISCACIHRYEDEAGNAREALVVLSHQGHLTTFPILETPTGDVACTPLRSILAPCRRALHISICPFVHSTLLIVTPERWLLYTAADLQLILAVPCPEACSWVGGCFANVGSVITFADDGSAYMYNMAGRPELCTYFQPAIPRICAKPPTPVPSTNSMEAKVGAGSNANDNAVEGTSQSVKKVEALSHASSSSTTLLRSRSTPAVAAPFPTHRFIIQGGPECIELGHPPVFCVSSALSQELLLLRGDAKGRIARWTLAWERSTNFRLPPRHGKHSTHHGASSTEHNSPLCKEIAGKEAVGGEDGGRGGEYVPGRFGGQSPSRLFSDVRSNSATLELPFTSAFGPAPDPILSSQGSPPTTPSSFAGTSFMISPSQSVPEGFRTVPDSPGSSDSAPPSPPPWHTIATAEYFLPWSESHSFLGISQSITSLLFIPRNSQREHDTSTTTTSTNTIADISDAAVFGFRDGTLAWEPLPHLLQLLGGQSDPAFRLFGGSDVAESSTAQTPASNVHRARNDIGVDGNVNVNVNTPIRSNSNSNDNNTNSSHRKRSSHLSPSVASISTSPARALQTSLYPKETLFLKGHTGSITCVFHPASHFPTVGWDVIVTGSVDCSVRVWSIKQGGRLIHTFRTLSAPISRIVAAPSQACPRVNGPFCAISHNHAVSLLSADPPTSLQCFTGHMFPIIDLRWMIAANMLLVQCEGDMVYVWQISSGIRERIVSGETARDLLRYDDGFEELEASDRSAGSALTPQKPAKIRRHMVSVMSSPIGDCIVPVVVFDIATICSTLGRDTNPRTATRVDPTTVSVVRAALSLWGLWSDSKEKALLSRLGLVPQSSLDISLGLMHNNCVSAYPPSSHYSPAWVRTGSFAAHAPIAIGAICLAATRSDLTTDDTQSDWLAITTYYSTQIQAALHPFLRYWSHAQTDIRDVSRAAVHALISSFSPAETAALASNCTARLPRVPYTPGDGVWLSCAVVVHVLHRINQATAEQIHLLSNSLNDLALSKGVAPMPRAIALEILSAMLAATLPQASSLRIINTIISIACADIPSDTKVGGAAARALTNVATGHADLLLRVLSADVNATASPLVLKAVARAVQQQPAALIQHMGAVVDFVIQCMSSHLHDEKVYSVAISTLNGIAQCCSSVSVHNSVGRAAVGAPDGTIVLFDIRGAVRLHVFTAHTRAVSAVAFNGDGRQLASYCGAEHSVRVWQLSPSALLGFLNLGPRLLRSIAVNGDHSVGGATARLVWLPQNDLCLHLGPKEIKLS